MSAAAAPALARPSLSREDAIRIINAMPYLVCTSESKLLPDMFTEKQKAHAKKHNQEHKVSRNPVIQSKFTVFSGGRSYTFDRQPFRVMKSISKEEFRKAAPWAATGKHHYVISTD